MDDVAPALLEAIETAFKNGYDKSDLIKGLLAKVEAGNATYEEASLFAETVGDLLADCYGRALSSEVLPDGRMYYNIAKKVVEPTLTNNYTLVADYSEQVQTALNKKAGIGLKAQRPELNQGKIDGIINRMDAAQEFDDVAWILKEPVTNFSMAVVDDAIKANVDFHYKAGLNPTVERIEAYRCCKWCRNLAGTYRYPNVPEDVYRRHENCRCRVEYDPKNGKRQDVHTKQWRDVDGSKKIEARKNFWTANKSDEKVILRTTDDPIREKLGSAFESNPKETNELIRNINEKGVGIEYREGVIGYEPNPTPGRPGKLVIEKESSYSAWLHEYKHILDDEASGWAGFRNFMNPEKAAQFEFDAYEIEIDYARKLGYNDIVSRLIKLRDNRLKEVRGHE